MTSEFDCVILGGGHNGLTSACYLAKNNKKVLILEALDQVGGAAVSIQAFKGKKANLSRYSYLVSLMPQQIIDELELKLNLISRSIGSYTPTKNNLGLLIERNIGEKTKESFLKLTGNDKDFKCWIDFYAKIEKIAQAIAPTLLKPLMSKEDFKKIVIDASDEETYKLLFETPITLAIEKLFENDVVRGVVLTDALIGTFTDGRKDLLGNICFLYHLIGNGNGEWKVPEGGMGQVSNALKEKALELGVEIRTNSKVIEVKSNERNVKVHFIDKNNQQLTAQADFVLSNLAPQVLNKLMGKSDNDQTQKYLFFQALV